MPQTVINNENEYRFTRSSKIVPQDETTVSTGPAATVSTSTTTTTTTQSTQNSHKPSTKNADDSSIQVNTREYLGDLSNQDTGHPGQLKRRPLGGDVQPLRQSAIVSHNNSNTGGTNAKDKELIPPRLPQKRQATESSTNLVEKLHISRHPHPHTSIQVNAVGPAGIQDIAAGSSSSVNVPYKKSKLTPVDYEWEDLDEEDMDDPLMASEYVNDIFPYLRELEIKSLPDSQYLFKQRHLKPKMRSILVDWLVEMHLRFRLLPETLFLAINIMDRFMSLEVVQIDKLQLLATGSLFIAAKYEEVFSPSVKNYAYFTDGSYTEEEILQAEKYILTVLNFDLSYPNPMNFLRRISKADDYDVQSRTLGKYLLEISIIDYKFIGVLPSLCSASAMYIARSILSKDPVWNGNLIHYSGGYRVSDMKDCIEKIIAFLVAPVEHDEFFKKYASRKFMKASILCRNWAKKVVQENRDIFV
ncbi:G2/mitotic-specific cyclin-2 [[Candida] railenensis]|uniref:G2/mitotic-specific cyclin-2 n=1 Tax=[Candida] railenensis TaxID=45579 RepID=A0A9P0QUW4_9ASCO|nr:G2/mitotic-specific cyclin-2 [[Candida] railenensis]